MGKEVNKVIDEIALLIEGKQLDEIVSILNEVKLGLHKLSPFSQEPVDCVLRVKQDAVSANEYNPNRVAPPEMELLEISILNDGYTQPIVGFQHDTGYEIVDGFHRSRVGKESKTVNQRICGYLPIVNIRKEQQNKNDRIASTIRHNRARGKHQVDAMSEIVIELKNRNWTNERIARELGMDQDEILRLCQITGLQTLFENEEFSKSRDADLSTEDYEELTDEMTENDIMEYRTANTSDPGRIFHTYDKRECYKHGFFATTAPVGMSNEMAEQEYYKVLTDIPLFSSLLERITQERKHSCEHYLTNTAMNRIAWLGQCAVCLHSGVPAKFSAGWNLLNEEQKEKANSVALEYLNKWLADRGYSELSINDAAAIGRQVQIY